ncbi:MAG: outer membrane porin, OprD family [Flavobacteriales bacterium]|nr:outer membrane porin, OprD family [Flavobacteriales bacterium]
MKFILPSLLFTFLSFSFYSQHHELTDKPVMWKGKQNQTKDTTSLLHAFKSGTAHGHFRYYFSSTINQGALTDYYANAIGGGIRYETNKFHGFQFAASGFYFFNIGSSSMTKVDSITGQVNRYEIGLFDIENPNNHKDMDRLEELYLKYNLNHGHLIFGRQLINTPLINLQDGRMRGTGVEGLWMDYELGKKWKFEGGYLYAISPRSTTKWYDVDESIGLYPQGISTSGLKSDYFGNLHSKGIGVLSVKYNPIKNFELQAWDYYIDNILNSALLQAKYTHSLKAENKLVLEGQFIRQDAIKNGGNENQTLTYIDKGAKSMTFGTRVNLKTKKIDYSLAYNRITKHGRYLFPREWGRDPFFTFIPRERSEGFGDVHALVGKIDLKPSKSGFRTSLATGYIWMPDVKNVELNKYGLPSYIHLSLDLRYKFQEFLKGMEAQVLVTSKINQGETYDNQRFVFNKVNMILINVILNYHF